MFNLLSRLCLFTFNVLENAKSHIVHISSLLGSCPVTSPRLTSQCFMYSQRLDGQGEVPERFVP